MQRERRMRVLISAGPTREPIDPVRFISNGSSGIMGSCLAQEALRRGHSVTVVSGPCQAKFPERARLVQVERACQMRRELARHMRAADALLMAAAVCDYRPRRPARYKRSRGGRWRITLEPTSDVVAGLRRKRKQVVVGFAVETRRGTSRMWRKLRQKRLDLLVGQWIGKGQGPIGTKEVKACLLGAGGAKASLGLISKSALARELLDEVERLWYGYNLSQKAPRRKAHLCKRSLSYAGQGL